MRLRARRWVIAQVFTLSPVHVYIATAPGTGVVPFQYLGTGRRKPQISRTRSRTPVPNDLAAGKRHDVIYGGQGVRVSVQFNRFNWPVFDRVVDAIGTVSGLALTPGRDQPGDRGAIMNEEGGSYQVLLAYPSARRPSFQRPGNFTPGGILIFGAVLGDDSDDVGWGDFATSLTWESEGVFNPAMTNGIGTGGYDVWRYITIAELNALPVPD